MKQFFFVFACLFCLAASLDNISLFPGRSGHIIISPSNIQDGSILLLLNNERVLHHTKENQIDEISVADLIGHLLGTPILNDEAPRKSFPTTSIFNKPTANLLVVIDGVDADQFLQLEGQKLKLNKVAYPQDNIASLTTISSGQTPSVHGIIGSSWRQNGRTVYGYSSVGSRSANFVDVLSQSFEGKSLTLSVSGDFQSASAFTVHKDLQAMMEDWNNQAFYWNTDSNRFDSLFGSNLGSSLQLSRSQIMSRATSRSNIELFDLKSQADFLFFAELEMVQSVVASLSSDAALSALAADTTPDAFTFVFSSIKGIVVKYGASSAQATAAASLVNELIAQAVQNMNAMYNDKLATEILVLAPSAYDEMKTDSVRQTVYAAVGSDAVSKEVFDAFFPSVYVKESVDSESACLSVAAKLPSGYIAECNTASEYMFLTLKATNDSNNTTNTTSDSSSSSAIFQIVLWTSILLALVLAGILYAMCGMADGDDTLLYRTAKKTA